MEVSALQGYALTKRDFDVLVCMERCKKRPTQRELAEYTKMSLGSINRSANALLEQGLIDENGLTSAGYAALEPYRVKRAVFLAGGFGERLIPITLSTPKPLIRVKGIRIIDTMLDALIRAGIEEIYIVRGYLGELFDQLLYKYPTVKFIENPVYNESGNISSAMCARHLFQNAYILEADLFLYNPDLIQKYQYSSNFLAVPTDTTNDWCFESKNNIITALKLGGVNCHHVFGISYWDEKDGARLREDIKTIYEMPGGKERLWDQVPLEYCQNNYRVAIRECSFDDIVEIDSYSDLKKIDNSY